VARLKLINYIYTINEKINDKLIILFILYIINVKSFVSYVS